MPPGAPLSPDPPPPALRTTAPPAPRAVGVKPFKLFRLWGIDVFLDWSWILVAVIEIQLRRNAFAHQFWNVLEYLTLFVLVLLHEFGHALACRSVGGAASQIILWPLGGIAYVQPPPRPGATLWSIAAGPLVNVVLLPITIALAYSARVYFPGLSHDAQRYIVAIAFINGGLLAYNILPFYPLDGGQILRSLLWFVVGRARSLRYAAIVGFVGAAAIGALALHTRSLWWFVLAAYGGTRSYRAYQQSSVLSLLEAMPRREGYRCPFCHAPPPRERIWRSPCGHAVDAFAGPCFHCSEPIDPVGCPDCGRVAPASAWAIPDPVFPPEDPRHGVPVGASALQATERGTPPTD